ncbi:hypothetical protein [Puniceicoccus vermicola]|uniref:J domain-containing protein n=1 Tax=Puniceicoccus vermicola TaxID=388746 RepID=A0A7X1B145_9BACT|nr:hypothetical protein [Puniceicoccus vermicola]MBC2603700.1 hypothetical protein [Puniceicoccus vermicola]
MNLVILIIAAIGGFVLVYKLIPSGKAEKRAEKDLPYTPSQPWFKVLQVPSDAQWSEIENRYRELSHQYSPAIIETLEPDLREDAYTLRREIDAAYRTARIRHSLPVED